MRKDACSTTIVLCAVMLLVQGCFESETELKESILAQDPSFAALIERKEHLDGLVAEKKQALLQLKNATEEKIQTLRRQYRAVEDGYKLDARKIKDRLAPALLERENNLQALTVQHDDANLVFTQTRERLKTVEGLLEKKEHSTISSQEIAILKKQLELLNAAYNKELTEVEELKRAVELEKKKIRYLRL